MNRRRTINVTLLLMLPVVTGCQWSSDRSSSQSQVAQRDWQPSPRLDSTNQFSENSSQDAAAIKLAELQRANAAQENMVSRTWRQMQDAVAYSFASQSRSVDSDDPSLLSSRPAQISPGIYIHAAQLAEQNGTMEEAELRYRHAINSHPDDVPTLVGYARFLDRQGAFVKALDVYRRALHAEPNNAMVCNDLGLCLARHEKYEPAIEAMRRALTLAPGNARYANNLARTLVNVGQSDQAVDVLGTVHPEPVARYNVACLLFDAQDLEQAERHVNATLQIEPENSSAKALLAQLRQTQARSELPQSLARIPAVDPAPHTAQRSVYPVTHPSTWGYRTSPDDNVNAPTRPLPPTR